MNLLSKQRQFPIHYGFLVVNNENFYAKYLRQWIGVKRLAIANRREKNNNEFDILYHASNNEM